MKLLKLTRIFNYIFKNKCPNCDIYLKDNDCRVDYCIHCGWEK